MNEKREIYGLDEVWLEVKRFHATFQKPNPDIPVMQSVEDVTNRANWIRSEVEELEEAETLVDQADAYLDILYFAIGGLVELGIRPGALFEIVQAANMAKLHKCVKTGDMIPVIRSSDGKIIKPEGWISPEPMLEQAIQRQVQGRDALERYGV